MTVAAGPSANEHARTPASAASSRARAPLWHGELRTPAGMVACRVLNLSARGAQLEMDATLTPGQCVTLIMEPLGEILGLRSPGRATARPASTSTSTSHDPHGDQHAAPPAREADDFAGRLIALDPVARLLG